MPERPRNNAKRHEKSARLSYRAATGPLPPCGGRHLRLRAVQVGFQGCPYPVFRGPLAYPAGRQMPGPEWRNA
jgi:hypothetical protein